MCCTVFMSLYVLVYVHVQANWCMCVCLYVCVCMHVQCVHNFMFVCISYVCIRVCVSTVKQNRIAYVIILDVCDVLLFARVPDRTHIHAFVRT
jgi:hypothetical protein